MIKASSDTQQKTKVRSAALEDQASAKDFLGFTPYVNAILNFLENEHTKPPFTLSIEGDWGSGKSSFMLQLQNKLKSKKAIVINFNAWRHDRMESLWAGFALTFMQQLERKRGIVLRPFLNLIVLFRRFDWKRGFIELLLKIVLVGLYLSIAYSFFSRDGLSTVNQLLFGDKDKIEDLNLVEIMNSLGFVGLVIGGVFFFRKVTRILGNPLAIDLSTYISKPDYEGHTSFIENFHADFDKAVKVLAFKKEKIYVFIDDLDRAEIPKAAELMQGLNMMISDSPKIIFIIGMDREKVAAGVAAKYEPLLRYLGYSSSVQNNVSDALHFGSTFLQKFIQLSFRIPMSRKNDVKIFIDAMSNLDFQPQSNSESAGQAHAVMVEDGDDAEAIKTTVELVAPFFENNPRLLKQYLSAFRLKCHIAYNTGLFLGTDTITIPQVGKFVAMTMIWPKIIDDLVQSPSLIKEILTNPPSGESASQRSESWRQQKGFVEFLNLEANDIEAFEYNMTNVNYKRLLETSPAIVISANSGKENYTDESDSDVGLEPQTPREQTLTGSTSAANVASKPAK